MGRNGCIGAEIRIPEPIFLVSDFFKLYSNAVFSDNEPINMQRRNFEGWISGLECQDFIFQRLFGISNSRRNEIRKIEILGWFIHFLFYETFSRSGLFSGKYVSFQLNLSKQFIYINPSLLDIMDRVWQIKVWKNLLLSLDPDSPIWTILW